MEELGAKQRHCFCKNPQSVLLCALIQQVVSLQEPDIPAGLCSAKCWRPQTSKPRYCSTCSSCSAVKSSSWELHGSLERCCASSSNNSGKALYLVHGKEEWVIHPSWTVSTFSSSITLCERHTWFQGQLGAELL